MKGHEMARPTGRVGSWMTPWVRLDYVKSQLNSCQYTLRRELGMVGDAILTCDEADLLEFIDCAIAALERIKP